MKMNELPFECTAKSSRGGCIKDNRETGSFASLGRIDEVVGWFARGVGGGVCGEGNFGMFCFCTSARRKRVPVSNFGSLNR